MLHYPQTKFLLGQGGLLVTNNKNILIELKFLKPKVELV